MPPGVRFREKLCGGTLLRIRNRLRPTGHLDGRRPTVTGISLSRDDDPVAVERLFVLHVPIIRPVAAQPSSGIGNATRPVVTVSNYRQVLRTIATCSTATRTC